MEEQGLNNGSIQLFRKHQSIYSSMLFSVVTYLAFGLWPCPIPTFTGGLNEPIIFAEIFYILSVI